MNNIEDDTNNMTRIRKLRDLLGGGDYAFFVGVKEP